MYEPATMSDPILLIVRRGAIRRFARLQEKTAQLNVKVLWDRRQQSRRQNPGDVRQERRVGDRRKTDPAAWDTADFGVVTSGQSPPTDQH